MLHLHVSKYLYLYISPADVTHARAPNNRTRTDVIKYSVACTRESKNSNNRNPPLTHNNYPKTVIKLKKN